MAPAQSTISDAIFFVASNISVLAASLIVSKLLFRTQNSRNAGIAATLLFSYASIISITTVCGASGYMRQTPIFIASLILISATSGIFMFFRRGSKSFATSRQSENVNSEPLSIHVQILLAASFVVAVIIMLWGFISPPPPWDSYVYHLPFAATWLQDGRISLITVPFGDQAGTYFPSNTELYFAWLMIPFHSEILTNAAQFPFYICIAFSIYSLAVELGIQKNAAASSAAASLFIPGMMHQSVASEVDVVFAALFLLSLYFIVNCINSDFRTGSAFAAGLAAGLLGGTKYIGLLFAAIIVIPSLILFIKNRKPYCAIAFLAASFSMCCFWYLRNWSVTGNPLFPLTFKLLGIEIFSGGYTKSSMYYSIFHSSSPSEWLSSIVVTTGKPIGILAGAAMIASPILLVISRSRRNALIPISLIPALILTICALAIPYNLESRFTYSAWAIALMCFSIFLESPNKHIRLISYAALFIAISASVIENEFFKSAALSSASVFIPSLSTGGGFFASLRPACALLIFSASLFVAGCSIYFYKRTNAARLAGLLIASLSIPVLVFAANTLLPKYRGYRLAGDPTFTLGAAWRTLDEVQYRNGNAPANVAFTGTDLSFGLYGRYLQNRVYYVSINKHFGWKFHDCVNYLKERGEYSVPKTDRIDFCRRDPDSIAWIRNLSESDTDFVVVSVLHQNDLPHLWHDERGFPIELSWALSNPGRFRLIYANRHVYLFAFDADI